MVGVFHFVRRVSQVIRVKGRRTVRNAVLGITDSTGWSCWPPVHGEILIKQLLGAEPSHDNRLASDSVRGWPEAVRNPRLSPPGYYRANLGALGIC